MVKALFDTNILIDFLNGVDQARSELALYQDKAISIITWMEVQIGTGAHDQSAVDGFLSGFVVLPLDSEVSKRAVDLRKANAVKLPDAVIWATAQVHSRLFVTRNTKDFDTTLPGVRNPYIL